MSEVAHDAAPPPGRWLLRPAGVLTQLACAFALLIGTISFVLVQQNKTGGAGYVIAWAATALVGIVVAGLMARGGTLSVIMGALINAALGVALLVLDWDTLRSLLRLLPESDVAMLADVLVGSAVGLLVIAALCLLSIPQARRYHRALREAEEVAEKSGMWTGPSASNAPMMVQFPTHPPAHVAMSPPMVLPTQEQQFRGGYGASSSNAHMPAQPPHRISANLPLPAPPETGDGYLPRPSGPPLMPDAPYIPPSAATAPGWTPAPARTYTTQMLVRAPAVEQRSRRRAYLALAGFAIGVGVGVGVLVSSVQKEKRAEIRAVKIEMTASGSGSGSGKGKGTGMGTGAESGSSDFGSGTEPVIVVTVPVRQFLATQRELIAAGDISNLALTFAPTAFAFGIDADDVGEGREAVQAILQKHLGTGGWSVTSRFLAVGTEKNHAWTAEELELSGANVATRRIAITQLIAFTGDTWKVVAAHWARPVADATAERLAIMGTLPIPRTIPDRADDAELGTAVAAAFASRSAFSAARSERDDGFNFGSGPGERVVGGAKIKALFGRLRSDLRLDGGARVVAASAWDPSQATAPWIGFAALNARYTAKSRAATDVTQTFRVLAVMLREGAEWKIVQTQFSNAGPLAE